MKLNGIQFISVSKFQSFGKNHESQKHETNQPTNEVIAASLWETKNKQEIPFAQYFTKVDYSRFIPPDPEKPGNFKVCNIDKLTCPSCGNPMFPRPLYEDLKLTLELVPEKEYIDILSKFVEYMPEVEANVFKEVKDLAEDYPKMNLKQLIVELKEEKLPQLEAIQFKKLNYMKTFAKELPGNERYNVLQVIESSESKIKQREIKHPFKRKKFIDAIKDVRIRKPETKKRLIEIAESFPSSNEAECAWIVKYSGRDNNGKPRSSREIAERFLLRASTNTDHMLAQDLGGKDKIPNYIAMHSGCNGDKTNKTFMEWFNEDPEARKNYIQTYLEEVQAAIDSGELDDPMYKNYPKEAAETIKKLSGGTLIFNLERTNASVH